MDRVAIFKELEDIVMDSHLFYAILIAMFAVAFCVGMAKKDD